MLYLLTKAAVSGLIVVIVSEVTKRSPGLGALIVSLPVISILSFFWLWWDTGDNEQIAALSGATFWLILPTLPMFLVFPLLLRQGLHFWPSLGACMALTSGLYLITLWVFAKFGVRLLG
jgi:hypothetical protein